MALIQSVGAWGSSPVTIAATQAGSTIIVLIGTTGATPTVSDNLGTVYTKVSVVFNSSLPLYCFYARVNAGVNSISITNLGNACAFISEESGLASTLLDSVSVGYTNGSGATTWTTNPVNVATNSGVGYVYTHYTGSAGMTGFGVNDPWQVLSGTGITGGVVTNTSYGSQAGAGRRTITAAGSYTGAGFTAASWYPMTFVIFFKSSPTMKISSNLSITTTTGGLVVTANDDFNRGDTTATDLGGNWGAISGYVTGKIVNNQYRGTTTGHSRNYLTTPLTANQWAQMTVANTISLNTSAVNLFLRYDPTAAIGYGVSFLPIPNGAVEIYARSGGVSTLIANTAYDTANSVFFGDVIRAEVLGSTITGYINGVAKVSVSNTQFTSGNVAIGVYNLSTETDTILDNFSAGNLTARANSTTVYGPAVQILNMVEVASYFSDSFTRNNEAPLTGNWETLEGNGLQLVSNACRTNGASTVDDVSGVKVSAVSFAADQYAQVTLGPPNTFDYPGVALRFTSAGSGTGYVVCYGDRGGPTTNIFTVWKVVSNAYTQIGANITQTVATGGILKAEAVTSGTGVNINVYYNGVLIGTRTDTSSVISSGQPGMFYNYQNSTTFTIDDFVAGNINPISKLYANGTYVTSQFIEA